ncbi:major facilitator superfamily domain-containing protein [Podospora didyma]|uniref:Major facilitator superfamily domain-containing protein n=1 Tax=Podospora didyma TaxID=330526 RepID=A0AAE0KDE0_9PEZI|nr:major facilitator superfamily domain-containing protein [Podospora didyma]
MAVTTTAATADETQPLLLETNSLNGTAASAFAAIADLRGETEVTCSPSDESTVVDFDPSGDSDSPLDWPTPFKWSIVLMLAMMGFTITFTCISVVPLASHIARDLSGSDDGATKAASVLLVTIWELGESAGPLLIAPLSELFGRYAVVNGANVLFILATILAATSSSVSQFVVARCLTGLAVATNVLSPAIVGDMFVSEERGSALSLVFLAPLVGGAVGPAISGLIAEHFGWRAVVWLSAVLSTLCEVLFFTFFRETYKVAILRRRAARMTRIIGKPFRTAFDKDQSDMSQTNKSGLKRLRDSILRPGIVLSGSGVLMAISVFGSISFSFYYVMAVTVADIARDVYGLSPSMAGLCFMSFSAGSTISVFACNHSLDSIYIRMRDAAGKGVGRPEYRLPLTIVGAFAMPLAVAAYGWTAQLQLPVVFLLLSLALFGACMMISLIPLMAYIVDAFGLYSASAMTGIIVTRCLMGTFLPLATTPLVANFGYGWGMSVFAASSLAIAPIPVLIMRYGAKWRQCSVYSRDGQ